MKRKRLERSCSNTVCTCGRIIPPGEWYRQHFDENGVSTHLTCAKCSNGKPIDNSLALPRGGEFENLADTVRSLTDVLDYGWGLLYPGKTDWEYPGQVINHLHGEIQIQKKKLEALADQKAKSAAVIRERVNRIIKTCQSDLKNDKFLFQTVNDREEYIENRANEILRLLDELEKPVKDDDNAKATAS